MEKKNHLSGENGLTVIKRRSPWRVLLIGVLPLVLAACASSSPAPVEEHEMEQRVRAPAREDSEGIQVYPLKNSAAADLAEQAATAEADGDYDQAAVLLERALRIQPRDPELLQQMAEVQMQRGQFRQALAFSTRSHDIGPRVGELCARNWRTMSLAHERLGDGAAARRADDRADQCMVTRPQGL